MSLVDNLLDAARRTDRQEARRVADALNSALDASLRDPDATGDGLAAVTAVDAAHRRVTGQIAEEKRPRATPPAAHTAAFTETVGTEPPLIRDAEPPLEDDVRNDPHYQLPHPASGDGDDAEQGDGASPAEVDPPWHIPERVAGPPSPLISNDDDDDDDTSEAVTHPPSATDSYPDTLPGFSDGEELDLPPLNPVEPAPEPEQTETEPEPEPLATPPPQQVDAPAPAPGPGLAQRLREHLSGTLNSLRGPQGRPKLIAVGAGAAVVLLIAVAAVFSLSGGRGKPPEPAGALTAPPSSAAPDPARVEKPLVPATVSASCEGDTDAVAPFSGEKARAWVCGRANGLDGSVLNITFSRAVVVTSITVVPGFNYVAPDGRDEWDRHRLVTGITWRLGGKSFPQAITPTRTGATLKLPGVITQEMSATITASVRSPAPQGSGGGVGFGKPAGDTDDPDATTAISSIVITGYPVDPGT